MRPSRRELLAALAGTGMAGSAGCGGDGSGGTGDPARGTTGGGPVDTDGTPGTATPELQASIVATDQTSDGTRVVDGVVVPEAERQWWLAVAPVESGRPATDAVLGTVRVEPGAHADVVVPIDDPIGTGGRLAALFFVNTQFAEGERRFDGTDQSPVLRRGDYVMATFTLSVEGPPTTTTTTAAPAEPTADHVVAVTGDGFEPQVVEIDPGASVAWVNRDDESHWFQPARDADRSDVTIPFREWTLLGRLPAGETGRLEPGDFLQVVFEEAAVYPYSCTVHGNHEECGAVVVGDAPFRRGGLPCVAGIEVELTRGAFSPAVVSGDRIPHAWTDSLDLDRVHLGFADRDGEGHVVEPLRQMDAATRSALPEAKREYVEANVPPPPEDPAERRHWQVQPGGSREVVVEPSDSGAYFCSEHGPLEESFGVAVTSSGEDGTVGATHVDFLPSTDATVTLGPDGFSPRVVEVPVGGVVEWTRPDTSATDGSSDDEAVVPTVSSWQFLSSEGYETLTDAQEELLDGTPEAWAAFDRPLPPGTSVFHACVADTVYPFFDDAAGVQERCGAVVAGDASLESDLPCEE